MIAFPSRAKGPRRLRLFLPLLELLDDLALLVALSRPLGRLQTGGGVTLFAFGELVARLGVRLVPLALLYVAPAIYAHPLPPGRVGRRGSCGYALVVPGSPASRRTRRGKDQTLPRC